MKALTTLALAVATLLATPAAAQRAQATGPITLLVSPTGTDAGVCAPSPCRTINFAADVIDQYDMRGHIPTVSVADGVYVESVTRYGCAGILPGMTMFGAGIPNQVTVLACDMNSSMLALNASLPGAGPNASVYFCACGGQHMTISANAQVQLGTNGGQTPMHISIGWPAVYSAAHHVVGFNGTFVGGATYDVQNTDGVKFTVYANGVLYAGSQGIGGLPGSAISPVWSGGKAMSDTTMMQP